MDRNTDRPPAGRDARRVLLLSDTHGFVDERILALAANVDLVAHGGDVGGAAVLESLRRACADVRAVRGNNDTARKWKVGDVAALDDIPQEWRVDLPGGVLAVVHGDAFAPAARHRRLRDAYADARAVLYGHSHRLAIDDSATPWVLNPGAAGRARTYGGPSCLVLTAGTVAWNVEAIRFPTSL